MVNAAGTEMDFPDAVYGVLAGVWVGVTSFFGISWFRDLSARVQVLEEMTILQAQQIEELKTERDHLRGRLKKYGIDEDSEGE